MNRDLVEAHLPLVRHVVFQVAVNFPRHVDRDELVAAGGLGLVEAAHRFDETRGLPFTPFAASRIRGAILDHLRSVDWAPRSLRAFARRQESAEQRLAGTLGRSPSTAETAVALDMTVETLDLLRARLFRSTVLAIEYKTTDPDEELTLADVLADERTGDPSVALERVELAGYLNDAVALLPGQHRIVVVGYFVQGRKSAALADLLGVTESRISQIRSEAVVMLRDGIDAQYRDRPSTAPVGRVERRQDAYAAAIGDARPWHDRLNA